MLIFWSIQKILKSFYSLQFLKQKLSIENWAMILHFFLLSPMKYNRSICRIFIGAQTTAVSSTTSSIGLWTIDIQWKCSMSGAVLHHTRFQIFNHIRIGHMCSGLQNVGFLHSTLTVYLHITFLNSYIYYINCIEGGTSLMAQYVVFPMSADCPSFGWNSPSAATVPFTRMV